MSKIVIPQLASFDAGNGFGSSVVKPNIPQLANLTSLNMFGTAYSVLENTALIKYFSSITGLPTGLSLDDNGLTCTTGGTTQFVLGDLKEASDGTTFFMITPNTDATAVTVATHGILTGVDGRFSATIRYINASAGATKPFIRTHTLAATQVTTTSNAAITVTKPNTSAYAINFNEPLLFSVTKDVANLKIVSRIRQGNVYAKSEQAAGTLATGQASQAIRFGNTISTAPGPYTLHAGGYYNNYVITDNDFTDLYNSLIDTITSI
jgi:hypothetical protein